MKEARRAVLVIAHHGYREEELERPRAALAKAGVEVEVVSSALAPARGMHDGTCYPDRLVGAVRVDELDALVFVGGNGATEYFEDRAVHRLAREALESGRVVGAICFASSILANAGLLEGRDATGFPSREPHLVARGARYTGAPVEVSGGLVTGRGPEDAEAFAQALVAALGRGA